MFEIYLTDQAREQLTNLKTDRGLAKRYKSVVKAIRFLSENPRHPGLSTHEFTTLKGPKGEKFLKHMRNRGRRQPIGFSGTTDP